MGGFWLTSKHLRGLWAHKCWTSTYLGKTFKLSLISLQIITCFRTGHAHPNQDSFKLTNYSRIFILRNSNNSPFYLILLQFNIKLLQTPNPRWKKSFSLVLLCLLFILPIYQANSNKTAVSSWLMATKTLGTKKWTFKL